MSLSIWINGIVWITDEIYTVFTDYSNFSHLSLTRKVISYYFFLFSFLSVYICLTMAVWYIWHSVFDVIYNFIFLFMFQAAINANVVDFIFYFDWTFIESCNLQLLLWFRVWLNFTIHWTYCCVCCMDELKTESTKSSPYGFASKLFFVFAKIRLITVLSQFHMLKSINFEMLSHRVFATFFVSC